MKTLVSSAFIIALLLIVGTTNAQQTDKQAKEQAKAASIKSKIDAQRYTFVAQYALPLRGGQKYLTSDYDLKVRKDSVIAYLPYFGRAYMDVPYGATDDGVKFTSTKFTYVVTPKKKGGWTITITLQDVRRTSKLNIDIFTNGTASVQALSNGRDAISFSGYIKDDKKK
ncbi:protein of unknown function [Mucilaginibacter mallensis]|uniref:DUF4251 domain-containing protein n=1 Tax=Mucilaginibacter mallensis TaxID=652787 RepID=A0A1H1Z9C7_MUCMA|nr:DUF4251 domain-containing protein [Mucilaginibacter mallensis]SDT30270.1 protein of unknown function [Mucilaginibacter mallensis]